MLLLSLLLLLLLQVRAQMWDEEVRGENGGSTYSGYTVCAGETVYAPKDYWDVGYKVRPALRGGHSHINQKPELTRKTCIPPCSHTPYLALITMSHERAHTEQFRSQFHDSAGRSFGAYRSLICLICYDLDHVCRGGSTCDAAALAYTVRVFEVRPLGDSCWARSTIS